jgi:hypothetical protein
MWIAFIAIANVSHQMIEAFLLSVAVVVFSYLIYINIPVNKSGIYSKNGSSRETKKDSSRSNYLQVFFNTPVN